MDPEGKNNNQPHWSSRSKYFSPPQFVLKIVFIVTSFLTLAALVTQTSLGGWFGYVQHPKEIIGAIKHEPATVYSPTKFRRECLKFGQRLSIHNAHVNIAEYVPEGSTVSFPDHHPTCKEKEITAGTDFCRLALYVSTSKSSNYFSSKSSGIHMEAWLPRNWTGRFLATGNGGLAGCIQYPDLAYGSRMGFAVVGANNGHNGTSGLPFYKSPEVVKDFAWRSVHKSTEIGKKITKQFYKRTPKKSYWLGCSTGGRQGFKEAQDFPEDFDGIVAGAPAFDFIGLLAWSGWTSVTAGLDKDDPAFITPSLWQMIHDDVLKQCDALDGAKDGLIEDPSHCHPDYSHLLCTSTSITGNCLSIEQLFRLRSIFQPLTDQKGELLYPAPYPGAETEAFHAFYNGNFFGYTLDWFRYVVLNKPRWTPTPLGKAKGRPTHFTKEDIARAIKQDPYDVSTFKANLTKFASRGGKLLTYHGMYDPVIPASNSIRYYQNVAKEMKLSPSKMDDFYRLFKIGGMGHCQHGSGANNIGNYDNFDREMQSDPESNVLMAIVRWVEEDIAPKTIKGFGYKGGKATNGVELSRKHCRHPRRNMFLGRDEHSKAVKVTDPSGWRCVLDDEED